MVDEDGINVNDDFVDLFFIDINTYSSIATTYEGEEGIGNITLGFRLMCTEDYYGPNCTTFCVERDDELGHYTCDSEGNRVCREGYQDPSANCTTNSKSSLAGSGE